MILILIQLFNVGPQHPSTHGVLRLLILLDSEIIIWIGPELGLLHRGTEKLIELNYYSSSLPYFDRLDYISTISQELLFIQAIERLLSSYCYDFISLWRTIFLEFYRNLNHILNIVTHAIDIGLFTSMLWLFDEREKLINYIEVLSGTRFHVAFILLGRLRYDISLNWINSFIYWILHYSKKIKELHGILSISKLWRIRLHEIGIISKDFCHYFGLSGIIARSISILLDCRFLGYEYYNTINYCIYFSLIGDCLDRYLLRLNEIIESCRLLYLLILITFDSFTINYSILSSIMELLINDFFINYPVLITLIQSTKISIESSKGIYSLFISSYPLLTINIITSDYIALNSINYITIYLNLADLITLLGSIDFVLGSIDL